MTSVYKSAKALLLTCLPLLSCLTLVAQNHSLVQLTVGDLRVASATDLAAIARTTSDSTPVRSYRTATRLDSGVFVGYDRLGDTVVRDERTYLWLATGAARPDERNTLRYYVDGAVQFVRRIEWKHRLRGDGAQWARAYDVPAFGQPGYLSQEILDVPLAPNLTRSSNMIWAADGTITLRDIRLVQTSADVDTAVHEEYVLLDTLTRTPSGPYDTRIRRFDSLYADTRTGLHVYEFATNDPDNMNFRGRTQRVRTFDAQDRLLTETTQQTGEDIGGVATDTYEEFAYAYSSGPTGDTVRVRDARADTVAYTETTTYSSATRTEQLDRYDSRGALTRRDVRVYDETADANVVYHDWRFFAPDGTVTSSYEYFAYFSELSTIASTPGKAAPCTGSSAGSRKLQLRNDADVPQRYRLLDFGGRLTHVTPELMPGSAMDVSVPRPGLYVLVGELSGCSSKVLVR